VTSSAVRFQIPGRNYGVHTVTRFTDVQEMLPINDGALLLALVSRRGKGGHYEMLLSSEHNVAYID
jgi:hypothetical protein